MSCRPDQPDAPLGQAARRAFRQRYWPATGLALTVIAALACAPALAPWQVAGIACILGMLVWLAVAAPRIEADLALRESEQNFRTVVEQSLVGLYVVQDGKMVYANPKLADMLGYRNPADIIGRDNMELVAPEDRELSTEYHRQRLAGEARSIRYTYRALKRDGSRVWLDVHGSAHDFRGRPAVMGVALDVSRQVESDHRSRLASQVFQSASEGIIITDAAHRIQAVNPAFTRITGHEAARVVGKRSRMLTGSGENGVDTDMLERLERDGHWEGEMRDRRSNGEWYPAWLSISTVRDVNGSITNYVGVFTDNTSRKEAETRLRFLASHDSLTGMLNRSGLIARFSEEIERARADGRQLALLFVDLDRFKTVNDTLGHSAGDQLLVAAAERMRCQIKSGDIMARLGGDEFTVLMEETSQGTAAMVAERLVAAMSQPFVIDTQEMFVTVSIGIACYPRDGHDSVTLLKNADVAMYRAKELGRNTFQFFTEDMNTQSFGRMLLENSLRHGLARGEFELHYQPQVSARSGEIVAVEALIRWRHPELGLVKPETFIGLAEQNGLIVPIGAWVLREACRQGRAWLDAGHRFGRIAINLSARQFSSGDLLDVIAEALDQSGLPGERLELEITESAIMQNPEEAVQLLQRLRAMGVSLAIDDFGTGYSSLANLKQYPIDNLKIDRAFVNGIPHDADDVAITEAIIAIAHKMGLKVIAEGVETKEQSLFLTAAGCDVAQGFLFGRPVEAREMGREFGVRAIGVA